MRGVDDILIAVTDGLRASVKRWRHLGKGHSEISTGLLIVR